MYSHFIWFKCSASISKILSLPNRGVFLGVKLAPRRVGSVWATRIDLGDCHISRKLLFPN